jgi:hypothetical protein
MKTEKRKYEVTVEIEVEILDDEYFDLSEVKRDIKRCVTSSSIGGMVSVRPKRAKNIKRV